MSLFVVQHEHAAETCPAGHPEMGPMLLKHVAHENAAKAGVNILGDAVIDGKHTFVLIVDAADEARVRAFMAPFAQMGSVEISPASSCEQVIERAQC
jgi:hypothetical protein